MNRTQFPGALLLGSDRSELVTLVEAAGEPTFRAQQLLEAIYRQRVESIDRIRTLPEPFRAKLTSQGYSIGLPTIEQRFISRDGTVRYLVGFSDGQSVETVWMPEGDGGETGDGSEAGDSGENGSRAWDRATICVSSQVGCAVDCRFCLTALLGVKRNLSAGEIVGQVLRVLSAENAAPPRDRINLVFMGMGEPFLNYDNFMRSVRLLVEEVGIPQSRMTVSTAGIVPRIHDFGLEPIRPKLAISLNASNDEVCSRLMPINRKWNLDKLISAARQFPLRDRERITFEYVLLGGVNDQPGHARELVRLLRGKVALLNVIPYNPVAGLPYRTPSAAALGRFSEILTEGGINIQVRQRKGDRIDAACGQLRRSRKLPLPLEKS